MILITVCLVLTGQYIFVCTSSMLTESPFRTNGSNTSSQNYSPSIITFLLAGWISSSKTVRVFIPYVFLAILEVIDRGFKP